MSLAVVGDTEWDPKRIRRVATWVARLDALLPPGIELESFDGLAMITTTGPSAGDVRWGVDDFRGLFDGVAREIRATPRQRALALRCEASSDASRRLRPVQLSGTIAPGRGRRTLIGDRHADSK